MGNMRTEFVAEAEKLDIVKTFECGQCFRWNADSSGVYYGVAEKYPAAIWEKDGKVFARSDAPDGFWHGYFDMDSDYSKADERFMKVPYLKECVEYGRGIRILCQDPWEAVCSFIISQCNNITRIKGIVERLCALSGEKVRFEDREYSLFPSAERLAMMSEEDVAPLRCGYRAPYILNAAKAVYSGELDLISLKNVPYEQARKELMQIHGIGEKVANCAVLFGLHHMEAFPIDVWIKRSLKEHFPPEFDPASLGDMAGLAQQYIFYHARSEEKK